MMRRRADVVLAEAGLCESRERAKAAILAGNVRVNGEVLRKAGELIDVTASIEMLERPRFVSRGGDKLAGALNTFELDPTDARAIDVGASTGGFTDCLLQLGATSVVAVDVGYGQLAWSLRQDGRVTVVERTNIRHADIAALGAPFDLVVVDVSFISLRTVLPVLSALAAPEGAGVVALVKPQFEAGKGRVGKKGVVRESSIHIEVLAGVMAAIRSSDMVVCGLTWSPVRGPEGNIEFWVWFAHTGTDVDPPVETMVDAAHAALGA